MIDGIKIHLKSNRLHSLSECSLLAFAPHFEKKNVYIAPYKGLYFEKIKPKKDNGLAHLYLHGSLHRYHNEGLHNADDFTAADLRSVVSELPTFGIDVDKDRIENLEFGVNIELPFSCQRFFEALVSMPNKPFSELKIEKNGARGKVYGYEGKYDEYQLKIYDKKSQQTDGKETSNLLRVEYHASKMRPLKAANVRTLADLCDNSKLIHLGKLLLSTFKDCLMCDLSFEQTELLPIALRLKVLRWMNPHFWRSAAKTKTTEQTTTDRLQGLRPFERCEQKKQFAQFLKEYQADTVKTTVINLITQKMAVLLSCTPSVFAAVSSTNAPTEHKTDIYRKFLDALDKLTNKRQAKPRTERNGSPTANETDFKKLWSESQTAKNNHLEAFQNQLLADLCDGGKIRDLGALLLDSFKYELVETNLSDVQKNALIEAFRLKVLIWRYGGALPIGGENVSADAPTGLDAATVLDMLSVLGIVKIDNDLVMFSPPRKTAKNGQNTAKTVSTQTPDLMQNNDVSPSVKPLVKSAKNTVTNGFKTNVFPDTIRRENISVPKIRVRVNAADYLPKNRTEQRFDVAKSRVCACCEKNIDHKRPQTTFCSDKCRMKSHGKTRIRNRRKPEKIPPSVSAVDLATNDCGQVATVPILPKVPI